MDYRQELLFQQFGQPPSENESAAIKTYRQTVQYQPPDLRPARENDQPQGVGFRNGVPKPKLSSRKTNDPTRSTILYRIWRSLPGHIKALPHLGAGFTRYTGKVGVVWVLEYQP